MHKFWSSFFGYNPQEYWKKRGKTFFSEEFYDKDRYRVQEKKLINLLSTLNFSSILEFGCGFGRVTKLILENFQIEDFLAFDISPDLINKVKKLEQRFPQLKVKVADLLNLNINQKYDLVFGSDVLMHVPPNEINKTLDQLVNSSKHYVVNVDWFQKKNSI